MSLSDDRKAAIEAYLGETGKTINDLEATYWVDMLANGPQVPAANLASTVHAATSKTTPVDADEVPLIDSAASNGLKKLTWANLKTTLVAQLTNITSGFLGLVYVGTAAGAPAASSNSKKFAIFTDNGWLMRSNGAIWDRVGGGPVVIDTWANCNTYNLTDYDGCTFRVTDIGAGNIGVGGLDFIAAGGYLRPKNYVSSPIQLWGADFTDFATCGFLLVGGNGGTYSQTGTTLTVTLATHGIPAELNGSNCHVTIGTGLALTGWFSNFAYVDANTFTVTSDVSQSTSGNLAANTSNTTVPWKYTFPDGLIKRKDSIALAGYTRAKATAGTKTIRYLYSGAQRAASTITNSDVFTASGPSPQVFVGGDDRFLTSGATAMATDTDSTYSVQMQLATNTDWVWFLPNSVQWLPRFGL